MASPGTVTWIDADGVRYPMTFDVGMGLMDGAIGLGASPVEIRTDERAVDGSAVNNVRSPSKTLALPVMFEDSNLLDTVAESFIGRPSTLEVATAARTRQLLNVYYVSGLEGTAAQGNEGWKNDGSGSRWFRRTLELKATDPYWYGPEQVLGLGVPTTPNTWDAAIAWDSPIPWDGAGGGITSGQAWDAAVAWDAALPWDGGVNVDLGITSRVGAWPIITVNGPATSFQVVHLGTGQTVYMNTDTPLGDDSKLVIDSRPGAYRSIKVDGALAWQRVSPASDPAMQVKMGDLLSISLGGTDPGSYITISWRQRWRMP
jgi:hypothetical protein